MLKVETTLKESPGRGLGLFTVTELKVGITVHVEELGEVYVLNSMVNAMKDVNPIFYKFIKKYGTFHKAIDRWYLSLDDARFINHSDNPNLDYVWHNRSLVTNRAIRDGEELTCNYLYVCDDAMQNGLDFDESE